MNCKCIKYKGGAFIQMCDYKNCKNMKQPPTTPYTIRVDTEKLQSANSKTDAKQLRLRLAKIINNYLNKVK